MRSRQTSRSARLSKAPNARGGMGLLIDWTENQTVEMVEHIVHFPRLSTPPGGYRGQYEVFAEQVSRNAGQKGYQTRIFEHAAAQGIGYGNVPISHGIEETGNAELRFFVEFQWVAKVVVDVAQNDIHGMQAIDGVEPHAPIAHGEVIALHKGIAQIGREVGMLKIGGVKRPRGQYDDPGVFFIVRRNFR